MAQKLPSRKKPGRRIGEGAPIGNTNASDGCQWRGAIRKALTKDRTALDAIAGKLIAMAKRGDLKAIEMLGNRLDGSVQHVITGANGGPISIEAHRRGDLERLSDEQINQLETIYKTIEEDGESF